MIPYSNKCHILINMMLYSNEYDAIPICRTHGACVNTPNFDACVLAFTPSALSFNNTCYDFCGYNHFYIYIYM